MKKYQTKDSGKRSKYKSGFHRDIDTNKPRYDLIPPELLHRLAMVYTRGSQKYDDDNWRKADSEEEYRRFVASAFRHFEQWRAGNEDEDHAMQCVWNIISYEWHKNHKEDVDLF